MSRVVIPHLFTLFAGLQEDAFKNGLNDKVIEKFLQDGMDHSGLPFALRWSHRPNLGFPRRPFQVFRRRPGFALVPIADDAAVNGQRTLNWDRRGMIRVEFTAQPVALNSLAVTALDWHGDPIPGQRLQFNASARGRLYGPGISALQVTGRGSVIQIVGMDQETYANDPAWQRIELVGLPVRDELGPPHYAPHPQGPEPPVRSGVDAGVRRIEMARLMHLDPPDTELPDVPAPLWPPPETQEYLFGGGDGLRQMLQRVYECLRSTVDEDPDRRQVDFLSRVTVPGVQQVSGGSSRGPARVDLPVVAVGLLAAASDSYAATGLGYGTIDFPPTWQRPQENIVTPPGTVWSAFDYMVTAEFVGVVPSSSKPFKLDLAALAQLRHNPEPPVSLTAALLHRNPPTLVDVPESQAVQLTWRLSTQPQSYAAVRSQQTGQVEVLNAPRRKSGGFEPFLPERPPPVDGEIPPTARSTLIDPQVPVPLNGTRDVHYLVAGLDVFGRWSSWRNLVITVSAPAVGKPGLHSVTLLPGSEPTTGRTVPARLEIVFSWDWFERRPAKVVFHGTFFPPDSKPLPGEPAGFQLRAVGPPGAVVEVAFDPQTQAPSITSNHTGSLERIAPDIPPGPPPPNTNSDLRQYRLVLEGLECDFSSAAQVAYIVYIRGAERVRDNMLSDPVGPAVARAFDPIRPDPVILLADVLWTALPDATGRARRVLEWPAVAHAKGYVIWQATETALLQRIEPGLPLPVPGTSLRDRATALRDRLADPAKQARAAVAFTRLNTQLAPGTSYEVELPGSADVLYVYQVTAVSQSNEPAPRTNSLAFVAVPHLNRPGEPHARVRRLEDASGLRVAVAPGRGPAPAGYRVYRARNPLLVQEVGLMGPPKIEMNDPGWTDADLPGPDGGAPIRGRAVVDPVPPSWYPYYYRVIALGQQDMPEGQICGQSNASATQEAFLPPADPPRIDQVEELTSFGRIADIAAGARPEGVAFHPGRNRVYVANRDGDSVTIINAADGSVAATIPVLLEPIAVAVFQARDKIFVSSARGGGRMTVINGATNGRIDIAVGEGQQLGLAVNESNQLLYVALRGPDQLVVIDATSHTRTDPIPGIIRPTALAIHPARNRVYVTSPPTRSVAVVDGTTNTVMAMLAVGGQPVSVDVNPSTERMYVANATGRLLAIFDAATNARLGEIPLEKIPAVVKADPRTNLIFVSHPNDSTVTIIDGKDHMVIEQVSLPGQPLGLAVHPLQDRVYVGRQTNNSVAVLTAGRGVTNRVFSFQTDLPVHSTPLGEAYLEVHSAAIGSSGRVQRRTLLLVSPNQVKEGPPLRVLPDATPEQLAAMPEVRRGRPDSQGRASYTVRLRTEDVAGGAVLIIARDPLQRSTEVQVPEVTV
jgi:YVTN family beta-propeller protein